MLSAPSPWPPLISTALQPSASNRLPCFSTAASSAATPSSSSAHLVYAKWPAAPLHTTEAKFTIAHAGGTTDVTVNQRIMGGQWVLLGGFTMNASTAYSIALSDNPNGQVVADAVRHVLGRADLQRVFFA